VSYLNWPFAMSGHVQFGPTDAMSDTIEPLAVARDQPIDASVFDMPSGFTVIID
jgi:hypothetical protein